MSEKHTPWTPGEVMLDTMGRRNRKLDDRPCNHCGTMFRPMRSASRYCSRPCAWSNNGGQNRKDEVWWLDQKGYIQGRVVVDGQRVRIKQHRLVAARTIGRPLEPHEDVHHINGDKRDNRPENLQVLRHGDHTRLTNKTRVLARSLLTRIKGGTDA